LKAAREGECRTCKIVAHIVRRTEGEL